MQTVSDSARAILDGYAKITLHIYIEGTPIGAGIGSATYTPSCGSGDSFSVGNACSAGFTAVVAASLPGIRGKAITVKWDVDGTEYPLLSGVVESATVAAGRTTIEAYDHMYRKGAIPLMVPEALMDTCTGADALRELAKIMDVTIHPDTLAAAEGVTIQGGLSNLDTESSCSMAAGHLAGIMGGNAMFDRRGLFCIRGFSGVQWETQPYEGGAEAESGDYTVSGIAFQREEPMTVTNPDGSISEEMVMVAYTAGDGSLAMDNPLADQAAADLAFAALAGVTVRPGRYSFPGGLLLEPGDIFTVRSMDGV